MTNYQEIWRLLYRDDFDTIEKVSKKTGISEHSIALYIRALYNAKYLKVDTPHTKIKHHHLIRLVRKTGEVAPKLNKNSNTLVDMNTLEEFFITSKGLSEKNIKNHKNLIPTLTAIIKLGKNEVYKKEIWQKAGFDLPVKLSRWLPKLVALSILIKTDESYRNSPLFKVDLKKTERLLTLVNQYKSHNLAFQIFKKEFNV